MFVCLSAGYARLIEPHSIHVLYMGRSGIHRPKSLSKKLTPSHQRFFLYERKRTQLSYLSTMVVSYLSTIFFYNFFSYLTSLLIKSLTRYMLLYICNKYKRLIKSLTRYILLYICNKYKRLIESLTTSISLYICNKYKKTYRIPNDIYLIIYL